MRAFALSRAPVLAPLPPGLRSSTETHAGSDRHSWSPPGNGYDKRSGDVVVNGHVFPLQDQMPKHKTPSNSAPRPKAITSGGVVAKMKIHPTSATRLGSG